MSLKLRLPLFWTALGELLPRAVGLAITIFVGRMLGPRSFGIYSLAYSWVNLCWGAVDLGTSNYALRLLAEDRAAQRRTLSEIFLLNTILALLAVAIAGTAILFLLRDSSLKLTAIVMLIFLVTYAAYPDWYLRGTGALRELAVANFAVAGAWLAGTVVVQGLPQPAGFGLAWALSPLAGALAFWLRWPGGRLRLREGLRPHAWLGHLRISALFAVSGAISNATIPVMLSALGLISGFTALGSYALGLRLGLMAAGALWIVLQNLTPQLVELREALRPLRIIRGPFLLGVLGFGAFAMLYSYLLVPLLGRGYGAGFPWTMLGAALIVPWSAKLPVEVLLITNRLDFARISVQVVSLVGVLFAAATIPLIKQPIILPIAYLVSESIGTGLGWILLEGHRRKYEPSKN